jgi:hypothetical protein
LANSAKPKRLAITISGAVSLGSFEAGVLYELINAIGEHNRQPEVADNERIVIDVITGASAGGMTATIAAQKLMFESQSLQGAYANSLYLPWVNDISLDRLLEGSDDPGKSIFSSDLIAQISQTYLMQRYASPSASNRHPAAAANLQLGLALSNLNGVDFGVNVLMGPPFVYTRRQDQLTVAIDSGSAGCDAAAFWDPIRQAAISCGAFPFAFRVVELTRQAATYQRPGLVSNLLSTQRFAYTDGGTFDNEPLGMAKNLVDLVDDHLDTDSRFYVFVAPHARASTANMGFTAEVATHLRFAKQLAAAVLDQAQFQDWVVAEGVNGKVELFNRRAVSLKEVMLRDPTVTPKLRDCAELLLSLFFPPDASVSPEAEKARMRLRTQFASDYSQLPGPMNEVWIDSILAFETAADLGTRDEMSIYEITAQPSELASHGLFAFAGFFDREFRDHDYDVGRTKTREFLSRLTSGLGPIAMGPASSAAIRPIDPSLNGLDITAMDEGLREHVCDGLSLKARRIAQSILEGQGHKRPLAAVEAFALELALLRPGIRRLLRL